MKPGAIVLDVGVSREVDPETGKSRVAATSRPDVAEVAVVDLAEPGRRRPDDPRAAAAERGRDRGARPRGGAVSDRTHPAVDRVEEALKANGVEPRTRWFESATPTAVSAAAELGVEVGAIANSLVFTIDGEPLLVMTSGAHRVDTAWLGARLGGRSAAPTRRR